MFSVTKIKNIKNQLIALAFLPTLINCSMPRLSDKTVIPAHLPELSGSLITVGGLAAGAYIGTFLKEENSINIAVGVSIGSLVGGAVVYKYLNYFTPASKVNKIESILEKNSKKKDNPIWADVFEKERVNTEKLLANISKEYAAEDAPIITFFEKDFKPFSAHEKQARALIKVTKDYLKRENSNTFVACLKYWEYKETLLNSLNEKNKTIEDTLTALEAISIRLREDKNFYTHLKDFGKKEIPNAQLLLTNEQIKNLKSKNSYFNALFSNNVFVENFFNLIKLIIASMIAEKIIDTTTGSGN